MERLKFELPDHLWPKSIHVIDKMPLTGSGKVDYQSLEKEAEKED